MSDQPSMDARTACEAAERLVAGFSSDSAAPTTREAVWIVSSRSGDDVVVKFHAGDARRQLGKERFVYDQAGAVPGLCVPRVLGFDEEAIVLSRVPGVPLGAVVDQLSPEDLGGVSEELGATVRSLHGLGQPAFGYLLTWVHEPADTNREYLTRTFEDFLSEWARQGGDPDLARGVERSVSERSELFDHCRQAALCHDDLNPANVMVEKRDRRWALTGIIDFENARAADPLMDIAKAGYYLFSSISERLPRSAFLDGYGGLPDHAEELVRVYRMWSDLEMWVSLARAGVVGWRPALEADLAALIAGEAW